MKQWERTAEFIDKSMFYCDQMAGWKGSDPVGGCDSAMVLVLVVIIRGLGVNLQDVFGE